MAIQKLVAFVAACAMSAIVHAQTPVRVISFPGGANLPLWVRAPMDNKTPATILTPLFIRP